MLSVTDAYKKALSTPFQVRVRVDVVRAGTVVLNDVPILGGTVNVDASSWVRRTCTIAFPPMLSTGLYESKPLKELIFSKSDELRVRWGLVFPDSTTVWIPLGVFRVDRIPYHSANTDSVTIAGVDRCADISDDDFVQPYTKQAGSTTSLITQLIQETLPTVSVYDRTRKARDARVPPTQVDDSRADFIKKLADGIGAVVYVSPEGDFIIGDGPRLTDTAVATIRGGVDGTLVDASTEDSRDSVFNCVVVRGESPSGDFSPVQSTVKDTAASSKTRYGDRLAGHFGKVVRKFDIPTVTTVEQARTAALAKLGQYAGLYTPLDVSTVPMPHLEPGDTVLFVPEVKPAGESGRALVIDSWSMDLSAGGAFTINARDVREILLENE